MTEFTPGPWEFEQNMRGDGMPLPGYYITGPDEELDAPPVAEVWLKPDARLIAAAPVLYAALKELCEAYGIKSPTVDPHWTAARAALAAARRDET